MLAFAVTVPPSQSGWQDDILEAYLRNVANGSKDALAGLYEQTHAAIYGFILSILKNEQDAEDILQDTYLRIWKTAGSYTPRGKPLAWMFTVARNLALMRLREQSRTVPVAPEDWQSLFADQPEVSQEDRLLLSALLGSLSDEERQIIMLHAMTGLKHRQIAELLHLRLPTVLSKYNRALKKLRAAFVEVG